MPAIVSDDLVTMAAQALLEAVKSLKNENGVSIRPAMDVLAAKSAVMAAIVNCLGYPNAVIPTGWVEVNSFGERA